MAEFASSRGGTDPATHAALTEATARARLELEAALYPARAARSRRLSRLWELVGVCALGMVAAGFALFASFIFINLLFHYNPGL